MSEPILLTFRLGAFKITASVRDCNTAGENDPDAIIAYVVSVTCNGVDIPFSDLCRSAQIDIKKTAIEIYYKRKATIK